MSLTLKVKKVSEITENLSLYLQISFRGKVIFDYTPDKVLGTWNIQETIEHPLKMALQEDESVIIQVLQKRITHKTRIFATYSCSIGSLIDRPGLRLDQYMTDPENTTETKCRLTMDIIYKRPRDDQPMPSTSTTLSGIKIDTHDQGTRSKLDQTEMESRFVHHYIKQPIAVINYENWPVNVHVAEGKELQGHNIEPYVRVALGNDSQKTHVQSQNRNPVWRKDFAFEKKKMPAEQFFDEILQVTVQSKDTVIGKFKIDMWHVFEQPEHSFLSKWAVLTDDKSNDIKGYVKMDIVIKTKGTVEAGEKKKHKEDIERNLMLPPRIHRQRKVVDFCVHIYRANGLQKVNDELVKFSNDNVMKIPDTYVEVSFAGSKEITPVIKESSDPIYNKTIIFTELFPPMCRRIRIRLKDSHDIIGTHYIDLSQVTQASSKEMTGFGPTFGPSWIHLYGSLKDNGEQNKGIGEGAFYRGRILVSLDCIDRNFYEIGTSRCIEMDSFIKAEESHVISEKDFTLFGVCYEAGMINKDYEKGVQFHIGIGDAGSSIDNLHMKMEKQKTTKKIAEQLPLIHALGIDSIRSSTKFLEIVKGENHYLRIDSEKYSMGVPFKYDDLRGRLIQRTMLQHMFEKLERIGTIVEGCGYGPSRKLMIHVLNELLQQCRDFTGITDKKLEEQEILQGTAHRHDETRGSRSSSSELSKTFNLTTTLLDEELLHYRQKQLSGLESRIEALINILEHENDLKQVMPGFLSIRSVMLDLLRKPEHTFPDVFLWMTNRDKPVAYVRIPAEDVFYFPEDFAKGINCGQIRTYFLKPIDNGQRKDWKPQAKVDLLLWLGAKEDEGMALLKAPQGYILDESGVSSVLNSPFIRYKEYQTFTLRAHIYQGRSLLPSDPNGLSDPFVRVILQHQSKETEFRDGKRNPIWDQTLTFENIIIWGTIESLKASPPVIVVEVYDKDKGSSEFNGRSIIVPVVKLAEEKYEPPNFPPKLEWFPVIASGAKEGEVLAAFELFQVKEGVDSGIPKDTKSAGIVRVPMNIRPKLKKHIVEMLFWGVRKVKRGATFSRPKIEIDCGYVTSFSDDARPVILQSVVCKNAKENPNFENQVVTFDAKLPEDEKYKPPLSIAVKDKGYVSTYLVGSHVINSMQSFMVKAEDLGSLLPLRKGKEPKKGTAMKPRVTYARQETLRKYPRLEVNEPIYIPATERGVVDWWERYRISDPDFDTSDGDVEQYDISVIQVYDRELEKVEKFGGFTDFLHTFDLGIGKMIGSQYDDYRTIGKLKAAIRVWDNNLLQYYPFGNRNGSFRNIPSSYPIPLLVRVYCVQAKYLASRDPNGMSDPYLKVRVGSVKKGERSEFIAKDLNPDFGRLFEFHAKLPFDHTINIKVMDHDANGLDDLIGETSIDIEDRYFSKHRATCGLPAQLDFLTWRDVEKPTMILEQLCRNEDLDPPDYSQENICKIGNQTFALKTGDIPQESMLYRRERCALEVLNNFYRIKDKGYHLVPEHVETRVLYHKDRGNIPQGRLLMWVDIFRDGNGPPPPPVDIKVQGPEEMELRVIVLQTSDIPATERNLITGLHTSDIRVRGWLDGLEEDIQYTDIHYRSADGVGLFNWRFIFRFPYNKIDNTIDVIKKSHFWEFDASKRVNRPILNIQVWEADLLTDDIIGGIKIDLSKLKPPAKTAAECKTKAYQERRKKGSVKSLFYSWQAKGWWPVLRNISGEMSKENFTGYVELELHLLSHQEADRNPVGKKRDDPEGLKKPKRPSDSESWFLSPLRICSLMICNHKAFFIKLFLIFLLIIFIAIFVYSVPNYTAKKVIDII